MTDVIMLKMDFSEWLNEKMVKEGWTQSELARKAGITQGTIGHILAGRRGAGHDTLDGLSRAFKMPVDELYRIAGKFKPVTSSAKQTEELIYLFNQFPDNEKADLITYMRIKLTMLEKTGGTKT